MVVVSSGPDNPDFFNEVALARKNFNLNVEARSIVGRRQNNQDCIGYVTDKNGTLVVICCDGLGGHAHGELASSETVSFLAGEIFKLELGCDEDQLGKQLMPLIDQARKNLGHSRDDRDTTLVIGVVFEDKVFMINIGDSWAVFQQDGGQVIKTEVQGMGAWVWKTLRVHQPIDIHWTEIIPRKDKPWTLCLVTDGCDELTTEEIFEPLLGATQLCEIATERNSDNCSCILVRATPPAVDLNQEVIPDGAES